MKNSFLLIISITLWTNSFAQSWGNWISVGNGVEISFKFGKTSCSFANTYARLRNTSANKYCWVSVSFTTSCDNETQKLSINANNLLPGAVMESPGDWYSTSLQVSNITLTKLEDANCEVIINGNITIQPGNNTGNSGGNTGNSGSNNGNIPKIPYKNGGYGIYQNDNINNPKPQINYQQKQQQEDAATNNAMQAWKNSYQDNQNQINKINNSQNDFKQQQQKQQQLQAQQQLVRQQQQQQQQQEKLNQAQQQSISQQQSSDAVGSAIGLTIDLINQGKRKKWDRQYLEKANQFQSSYGITIDALENAVETNDSVAMEQMISKGFDLNVNIISQKLTLLCYAADKNRNEIVLMLLKAGAEINKGSLNNPGTYGGLTPLHCAAFNGNLELTKLLVENGANVNAQMDVCRVTPLWEAVEKNRLDIIRYLLSVGADRSLTIKWDNGSSFRINWTPFQYAKKLGYTQAADIIGY